MLPVCHLRDQRDATAHAHDGVGQNCLERQHAAARDVGVRVVLGRRKSFERITDRAIVVG